MGGGGRETEIEGPESQRLAGEKKRAHKGACREAAETGKTVVTQTCKAEALEKVGECPKLETCKEHILLEFLSRGVSRYPLSLPPVNS